MSLTLLITYSLLCLLLIVAQAEHEAMMFRANKPISHFWQGAFYGFVCGAIALAIIWDRWNEWHYYWEFALIGFTMRLAWFSPLLNLIRGKSFFYNGLNSTGSLTDKIENKLSKTAVAVLKIFYIGVWGVVSYLIYKQVI